MDLLDGTTGFDRVMAVLTILGFPGTGFGLFQAWHQAKRATTAAKRWPLRSLMKRELALVKGLSVCSWRSA